MEMSDGVFVSNVAAQEYEADPDVPGTEVHLNRESSVRAYCRSRVARRRRRREVRPFQRESTGGGSSSVTPVLAWKYLTICADTESHVGRGASRNRPLARASR